MAWLTILVLYIRHARGSAGSTATDLRHPARGPFGALAPVVAILIGGALAPEWLAGAVALVTVGVVGIAVLSAWMLAGWAAGSIRATFFHPGNYLSVLAGGLIGAIGLAQVGARSLALAAFGVGIFFWTVLTAVVIARTVDRTELPTALIPTLAIFSVPPSVAGIAWFAINGNSIDGVQQVLLALMVLLLLSQAFLVPLYRRVPVGIGYWSFTFSAASPATYGIQWLWIVRPWGWAAWSWLILSAVTLWIAGIAVLTAVRGLTAKT
jgi:tellurite resistance protein